MNDLLGFLLVSERGAGFTEPEARGRNREVLWVEDLVDYFSMIE